jgi:RHS repeat-associated protein
MTALNGQTITYTYDAASRMTRGEAKNGQSADIQYDALGRRIQVRFSNGARTTYRYDAGGQVTSVQHTDAQSRTLAGFTCAYDGGGNPVGVAETAGTHAYAYDDADRITGAAHPQQPAETYTYDAAHNRTGANGTPYSYDAAGQLLSVGDTRYSFDARGNVASRTDGQGRTAYAYDGENRLVQVQLPNGNTVSYAYDPLGRRIEKVVAGNCTAYVYDGENILIEDNPALGMTTYVSGRQTDDLLFYSTPTGVWFAHQDALGSIVATSDAKGAAAQKFTYATFGAPLSGGATGLTAWRFTGRQYDPETGLYDYRARTYDPATGRFLQTDPVWQVNGGAGFQLYGYANGNPLRFTDPLGTNPLVVALIVVGALAWAMYSLIRPAGTDTLPGSSSNTEAKGQELTDWQVRMANTLGRRGYDSPPSVRAEGFFVGDPLSKPYGIDENPQPVEPLQRQYRVRQLAGPRLPLRPPITGSCDTGK